MKKFLKKILKNIIPNMDLSDKIYSLYIKSNKWYKRGIYFIASYYTNKIYKKYNCIISSSAQIGKNVKFPHPIGIVIGNGVKIGNDVIIYQNVTLGRKNIDIPEYPTIEDNVIIYCNTAIIGNITIGRNSIVGCNSVVLKSVGENSKCIGIVK